MTYRFDEPVWREVLIAFRRDLIRLGLRVARLASASLERQ